MTRQANGRSAKRARLDEGAVTKNDELTSAAEGFFEALGKSNARYVYFVSNKHLS